MSLERYIRRGDLPRKGRSRGGNDGAKKSNVLFPRLDDPLYERVTRFYEKVGIQLDMDNEQAIKLIHGADLSNHFEKQLKKDLQGNPHGYQQAFGYTIHLALKIRLGLE